jgi:hypothetical protein
MHTARVIAAGVVALLVSSGCNPNPKDDLPANLGDVGYRTGLDGGAVSGERGTVKITEVGWAGSVTNEGVWDPDDQFLEIRNESARPMDLEGWRLIREGTTEITWVLPPMEPITVGGYLLITRKADGCFPDGNIVMPEIDFGWGDPFRLTLRDFDERLIEPAGSRDQPPFAGIYDGVVTRSMEKAELIFGGRGGEAESWHHYTSAEVDVPNNRGVAERCRQRTLASPGFANSPDYSGAFGAGATD